MTLGSGAVIGIVLLFFVVPAILQWLWNMTFPNLFDWPKIRYWEAFRIMLIADLLFGGAHLTFHNGAGGSWTDFGL